MPSSDSSASLAEREEYLKTLDKENRWVLLADEIHWEKLIDQYLSKNDFEKVHPKISARTMIAAFIIKYKLNLSSRATVQIISENQHLQYFAKAGKYFGSPPLTPELMRNIRDMFGKSDWPKFKHLILNSSFSTRFGRFMFRVKNQFKEYKPGIENAIALPNRNKILDAELYESIGLSYAGSRHSGRLLKRNTRKTKKLKKRVKKILDVIIWTVIVGLVVGSTIMILYESEWSRGKKKTEKNK